MSFSKSKQKFFPRQENAWKPPDLSFIHQVAEKVRLGFPNMRDSKEIKELTRRICSPEEITRYFDIIDLEDSKAKPMVTTLPVQLILKYYKQVEADVGPVESILQKQYGPLHTYLVIGDQILEWNWKSMVIPHGRPIADGSGIGAETGSVSDLEPITIDELTEVTIIIAEWNRLNYYDSIRRSSQDFVRTVLQTLHRPLPSQLETKIASYYERLEKVKDKSIPHFASHEGLDQFVIDNLGNLNEGGHGPEYLFSRYFMLHIKNHMMSEDPLTWKCQEPNCRMKLLEGIIDQEKMILKDYKTVRYDFHNSTSL